jgi:hypothetical protein
LKSPTQIAVGSGIFPALMYLEMAAGVKLSFFAARVLE